MAALLEAKNEGAAGAGIGIGGGGGAAAKDDGDGEGEREQKKQKEDDLVAGSVVSAFKSRIPKKPSTSKEEASPPDAKEKKKKLQKGKTFDVSGSSGSPSESKKRERKDSKKEKPSAYIDVTTDNIERHRPGNLPDPAVYVDVEGVDPVQPAYMGMTVEQMRAFKRANEADEQAYAVDDDLGNFGDDGGDW